MSSPSVRPISCGHNYSRGRAVHCAVLRVSCQGPHGTQVQANEAPKLSIGNRPGLAVMSAGQSRPRGI